MRYSVQFISNQTPQCKTVFASVGFALLIAILLASVGCTGTQETAADPPTNRAKPATADVSESKTTTVIVTPGGVAESPAAPLKLPNKETSPETICHLFVRYLSTGNRSMAEQMLTPSALTTTSRAELQLEPVGGPSAVYEMSEPRYATNKKKLCQIDCSIVDDMDGESVRTELTWICRMQKDGWRIAGMMVEVTPEQPRDYLSFENVDDVTRIKNSLIDNTFSEIRNAAQDDNTKRIK